MMVGQIALTALITVMARLAEHWFPWQLMLRRKLPRPAAYVAGVLALIAPLTVLFWQWGLSQAIWALWAVVISGGLAVMGAYGLDWLMRRLAQGDELRERVEHGQTGQAGEGLDGQA